MEGAILGYDKAAASGVIKGDDGKRYAFVQTEWKSEKDPRPGERVDYDASGENAVSVYPLKTANALADAIDAIPMEALKQRAADIGQRISKASGGNVKGLFLSKLENVFAAVIIVAFFMPWASYMGLSVSGVGVHSVIKMVSDMVSFASQMGAFDATPYGGRAAPAAPSMFSVYLMYTVYLIPVFACLTIWYNLQNVEKPFAWITAILPFVLMLYGFTKTGSDLFKIMDFGAYLTLLAAGGIIAAKLGYLKNPFKA